MTLGKRVDADNSQQTHALRRFLLGLLEVSALLAIIALPFSLLARWHFLPDLVTHFRIQLTLTLLVCGSIVTIGGSRRLGLGSLAVGVALLASLAPYFFSQRIQFEGPATRLLSFNVLTRNKEKDAVIDYLLQEEPDVLLLMEVSQHWLDLLCKRLSPTYPHQIDVPRSDNFGLAMFSKIPFEEADVVDLGDQGVPSIDAKFKNDQGLPFRVIGTHPVPPVGNSGWQSRNTQLAAVAEAVAAVDIPTLVAGDLNCSPWSPFFRDLLRDAELRDSGFGYGIPSTWYVGRTPVTSLPIDHVCIDDDIIVVNRRVGPPLGSDHRAVIVDFAVKSTVD